MTDQTGRDSVQGMEPKQLWKEWKLLRGSISYVHYRLNNHEVDMHGHNHGHTWTRTGRTTCLVLCCQQAANRWCFWPGLLDVFHTVGSLRKPTYSNDNMEVLANGQVALLIDALTFTSIFFGHLLSQVLLVWIRDSLLLSLRRNSKLLPASCRYSDPSQAASKPNEK